MRGIKRERIEILFPNLQCGNKLDCADQRNARSWIKVVLECIDEMSRVYFDINKDVEHLYSFSLVNRDCRIRDEIKRRKSK